MSTTVVVITGASSGIGRALAKNLASRPHGGDGSSFRLVLVARREEELKKAQEECGGDSVAKYFVADVTKQQEVAAAGKFAVESFGKVDVWINNAGRAVHARTTDLTEAQLNDMMQVNVFSALWGMQAAVGLFTGLGGKGQIINVSSLLGRNATLFPEGAAYNAAKHALNALTDNLRQDVQSQDATKNITVTLFSPGVVNTEFGHNSGTGDHSQIPYAQPVEEVAEGLRSCIEGKKEEMYSRPNYMR